MGSLARLVPRRERARVSGRAAALGPPAGDWPGPADPALRRRLCRTVAAIAPDLPDPRLALLAGYAGWSIRLDDRLDAAGADPDALAALERAVVAVTAGELVRPPGVLAPLPGLRDQLAGYDRSGGALLARWQAELRDAVSGGVRHALLGRAVAAGRQPPPTAEDYLAVAARTVNYRSFGYALLLLAGCGAATEPVDRALWHAAAAVRLANDRRSLDRDRAESTLNVLRLRTAAGRRVTDRWVRAGIARRRRAHDRTLAGTPPPVARLLTRCLRVSLDLYRHGDLR